MQVWPAVVAAQAPRLRDRRGPLWAIRGAIEGWRQGAIRPGEPATDVELGQGEPTWLSHIVKYQAGKTRQILGQRAALMPHLVWALKSLPCLLLQNPL